MRKVTIALVSVLFVLMPLKAYSDTGLGIIVGDPTGLSALFSERVALGLAWDIDDYLHVHADVWLLKGVLADPVDWYIGLGGKFKAFEVNAGGRDKDEKDVFGAGVRVPLGLQWYFLPEWELFLEIVPGISIIPGTDFDLDAGLGVRYHF